MTLSEETRRVLKDFILKNPSSMELKHNGKFNTEEICFGGILYLPDHIAACIEIFPYRDFPVKIRCSHRALPGNLGSVFSDEFEDIDEAVCAAIDHLYTEKPYIKFSDEENEIDDGMKKEKEVPHAH